MNKPLGIGLALALVCLLALGAAAQEKKRLKVYISVDMEGIGGVVSRDQTGPQGWEYLQARKWMTAEANAAIAGHFGVPVVLVSGDQTIIAETRNLLGGLEGAEVKSGIGTVAKMMHPKRARALIKEKAKAALARLRDFKPWRLSTPITIEITFKSEENAEVVGFFPGVRMVDGRTIQYTGKDMVEISGFLSALLGL